MEEKYVALLSGVFLFDGVDKKTLKLILERTNPKIEFFSPKQVIFSPDKYERKLAFIISGECTVERVKSDGSFIPLNSLKKYDSFGIMSLFSEEAEFPTSIVAKKNSELVFFTKEDVDEMIETSPRVAKNIIVFLTNRVAFLNAKIATFSSDTVEKKLANFLIIQEKKCGSEFEFNCKRTAEAINAGRASLYRALASLGEFGLIKNENKKIIILDPEGLERISK